uniref:Uncharacterized protein n=1 Tax=Elaeophora elaphi TaxID=1147741 RepID=A0A0R3RPW0_9BILA
MVATAAAAAAYGKLGGYQQQQQQQYGASVTSARQPQVHAKRSSSHSGGSNSNALRLQQRRMLDRENIDQLLQKCRTGYRGTACGIQVNLTFSSTNHTSISVMQNKIGYSRMIFA